MMARSLLPFFLALLLAGCAMPLGPAQLAAQRRAEREERRIENEERKMERQERLRELQEELQLAQARSAALSPVAAPMPAMAAPAPETERRLSVLESAIGSIRFILEQRQGQFLELRGLLRELGEAQ